MNQVLNMYPWFGMRGFLRPSHLYTTTNTRTYPILLDVIDLPAIEEKYIGPGWLTLNCTFTGLQTFFKNLSNLFLFFFIRGCNVLQWTQINMAETTTFRLEDQVQLTVKGSSNRTFPRFDEP